MLIRPTDAPVLVRHKNCVQSSSDRYLDVALSQRQEILAGSIQSELLYNTDSTEVDIL